MTCNICGTTCKGPAGPQGREVPSCPTCGSTIRLRSLIALLSREIFGIEMPLSDFPVLKSVRGFGMSDPEELAKLLAQKFDYTNTFYHQEPRLDIVADPAQNLLGQYDFILSSEVLEHVPPPVERAFVNLNRMLKPDGLLLLTVPYTVDGHTVEHFPELHEYALAAPGGRTVLVNRRRDGSLEVFENLSFHGGDGSTLEMRVFTETSLKETLTAAGFGEMNIASDDIPEYGVHHAETWSLPIVGRKGRFRPPSSELSAAYRSAAVQGASLARQLEERTQWALALEKEKETTKANFQRITTEADEAGRYIQALEKQVADARKEKETAVADFERGEAAAENARRHIKALETELTEARAARAKIESSFWNRLGRKLGAQ